MRTSAVIVAAGLSSRMKSRKPLLELGGASMIRTGIAALQAAGIRDIAIVTGNEAAALEKHVASLNVTCLFNPDYATTDMFHSVRIGLAYAQTRCDRVFLLPADMPLLSARSLQLMLEYMDDSGCGILIPAYQGRTGHPILLGAAAIPGIIGNPRAANLGEAIRLFAGKKETIELDDIGLLLDADKPQDSDKLNGYWKAETRKTPLSAAVYVSLSRKQLFFNDELRVLLRGVERHSSLNKACEEIGVSYSKGWKLVKIAEHQLGFVLLNCQIGGSSGGGSSLTEACRQFIKSFEDYTADVSRYAQHVFGSYFPDKSGIAEQERR